MKKFSSLNEDITSVYNYVVIREENFDEYYLFETEKDVINFVLNTIYETFNGNEKTLTLFDEDDALDKIKKSNDLEGLFQYYSDLQEDGFGGLSKMKYEQVKMIKNNELKDWIKLRKVSKQYNL